MLKTRQNQSKTVGTDRAIFDRELCSNLELLCGRGVDSRCQRIPNESLKDLWVEFDS